MSRTQLLMLDAPRAGAEGARTCLSESSAAGQSFAVRGLPGRRARRFPAPKLPALAGAFAAALAAALVLTACDREPPPAGSVVPRHGITIEAPESPPAYTISTDVREQYPEVAGFIQEFLETCLNGDYSGYRRLVSRMREPESQERFTAIYHAMSSVQVLKVEPLEISQLPAPVYRVICAVDFRPPEEGQTQRPVRLRERNRNVAILVFQEAGEWRMLPAPTELQPVEDRPASRPAASGGSSSRPAVPNYPWDEQGDY